MKFIHKNKTPFVFDIKKNMRIACLLLLIIPLIIFIRLFYLQTFLHEEFSSKADRAIYNFLAEDRLRGKVLDVNGRTLAESVRTHSCGINKRYVKDKKKTIIKYLESQFVIEPFEYKSVKTYKTKKQMLEDWGIDIDSYKVDGKIDKEKVLEVYNVVREKQLKKDYYARKYAEHQKYIETYTEKYLQDEPLWEFQALQIFLNNNPFDESYKYIKRIFTEIDENEDCVIVGVIAKVEKKKNKMNKQYAFVHIYSTFGIIEALVFAQKYQQYSELLYKGNQIAMLCTKSTDNQVLCDKVKPYNDWLEYSKARAKKGR